MDKSINQRLKKIREYYNYSQEIFSMLLGLKQTTYSKIETGITSVNNEIMKFLHEERDININWLISGKGNMFLNDDNNVVAEPQETYNNYKDKYYNMLEENRELRIKIDELNNCYSKNKTKT